ncbi:hypothetical protein ACIA98_42715 [Streptomyces sp. NPDC051366]|uniref:hypothetical protein n=1 Tax=Streptomyces sp. NPDC051366 TaxID=3365652 RepID=UPI00378E1498
MAAHLRRATAVAALVLASLVVAPAAAHAAGPVGDGTASKSLDPFNKQKIKIPKRALQKWIVEEGLDEGDIRESQERGAEFTDALNSLPFFQPLARTF